MLILSQSTHNRDPRDCDIAAQTQPTTVKQVFFVPSGHPFRVPITYVQVLQYSQTSPVHPGIL